MREVLGIAKKEFHDSIVDVVKRKRLSTDIEPEKPVEVRTTHIEIGDIEIDHHFFVQETSSHPVILGEPYITAAWMETKVLDNGSAYARVKSQDGRHSCWEWGRPPVRKRSLNILFVRKNLRMGDMEQDTHKERERETQKSIYLLATVTRMNNNLYKRLQSHFI